MIRRGQIYMGDLNPSGGPEQKGRRPVLVVSSDAINRQPLVIAVVVGTKAANVPRDYPTECKSIYFGKRPSRGYRFPLFPDPLARPGAVRCTATRRVLSNEKMSKIDEALKLALDFP